MSAQPGDFLKINLHLVDERPPGPGLSDFSLWLRSRGCSANTVEDRLSHIGDFANHYPSFPNSRPMEITAWLGREGLATWSRATYYGHLRSYYTFAMENDLIERDPMGRMKRPKPPRGEPRPLTVDQVEQLMAATRGRPAIRAYLILALYSGLRAHEIAKIRGEDVNEANLYVLGKGGQSAHIPVHPLVWEEACRRPEAGWWFPSRGASGHVSSMTVSTMASRLFKANGIEGSIHRCRHTYATRLLRAGNNIRVVQSLMRHASLSSTMIYTAVSEDERLEAIRTL
jgi:integrase/recombinase XerD